MGENSKKYITIPKCAKKLKYSPEYLRRLITSGKIPEGAWIAKGKRKLVDPDQVREALENNISHVNKKKKTSGSKKPEPKSELKPEQNRNQNTGKNGGNGKNEPSTDEKLEFLEAAGIDIENFESLGIDVGTDFKSLAGAQKIDMIYRALLRKQKFENDQGSLVSAQAVEKAAFESGRKIRDQLLSIPPRCAALVAKETDQFECNQILLKEISYVLEDLSDDLQVLE